MPTYQVPVFVDVDTTSASEARQIVIDALDGIPSWNDLLDRDPCIVSVTVGNEDEVVEAAPLSLLDTMYADWVLMDEAQGPVADTDEGEG